MATCSIISRPETACAFTITSTLNSSNAALPSSKTSKARKWELCLPERLTNVIRCRNPRCITTTEQELDHVFKLTDRENRVYRCMYCEAKAKKEG